MRLNLHSNGGNRHTLSEMCLTPVLINHPAVIAVIVIEGCGEGGNVTFEGVSVIDDSKSMTAMTMGVFIFLSS